MMSKAGHEQDSVQLQMMEDDHRVDNTWAAAFADTEEQRIHRKMEPVVGESGAVGSRWDKS